MKNKKLINTLLISIMSACLLLGCNKKQDDTSVNVNITNETNTAVKTEENKTDTESNDTSESEAEVNTDEFDFAKISNLVFSFSSGAGGWGTEMTIHADGTFEGQYHDSDMGDTEEDWPNGICYISDFNGKFSTPEKVNDYTYSMKIENINLDKSPDSEEIEDGVKYIYSDPYGLDEAENILIYLPGAPLKELPEEYRSWVNYYDLSTTKDTNLPFYGLYNETPGYGFSSYANEETSSIDDELSNIQAQADAIENDLKGQDLAQQEMNEKSGELYKLWDDELNSIWSRLKEELSEDEMSSLLTEQRTWISSKEEEIASAGAEYEGGSMQALIENEKGAELTKQRVYELAQKLQ